MANSSHHLLRGPLAQSAGFALGVITTLAVQFAGGSAAAPLVSVLARSLAEIPTQLGAQFPFVIALVALLICSVALAGWTLQRLRRQSNHLASPTAALKREHATAARAAPDSASRQAELDSARAEIERQLSALVGFVSRYLDATSDQAVRISQAQSRLEQASTIEQVQVVIRLLVASNAQARRDAEDLKARLMESRNFAAKVQSNLAQAVTLATIDPLTNLANRRRLEDYLGEQIAQSHRDHTPLCLVMADIDHFKAVNDKFGHPSGDAVLKQFADILAKSVRHTDFTARYGGEEFVVVLPRTPLGNASHVMESIRQKLSDAKWCGVPATRSIGKVTASFGIAEIRDEETLEQFIDRADQKLYEAKQNGRNRIEIDHSI